jgi:membrane protein DedA with SNARE-associated domain
VTLSPADVDRADDWFRRHGAKAVFFGRLIPTVRTLISVPAGIAGMPLPGFLAWSALGTVLWTTLLAGAGYLLQSQYERVSDYLNPVSTVVVVLIIGWYLYRVVTFRAVGREQTPEAKSS